MADNAKQNREEILNTRRSINLIKPLVSFIDDDGQAGILTKLKPLFTARNIPIGIALTSFCDVISDPLSRAEILDLQNNYGWEILGHSMLHDNMGLYTPEQVESDCKLFSKNFR